MTQRSKLNPNFAVAFIFHSLSLYIRHVQAEGFDCKLTVNKREYDLNELYGPHPLTRDFKTTPSFVVQNVTFDLCEDIIIEDGVQPWDQCEAGTRACLLEWNKKGNDPDRISKVIPLATNDYQPQVTKMKGEEGLTIIIPGPAYPPGQPYAELSAEQSFQLDVTCPPNDADSEAPVFSSYDGSKMKVTWKHKVVCPNHIPLPNGGRNISASSGVGYFFIFVLIAVIGYFGFGAYYNYNNYGASGWDLLPHRDFWREVPYLVSDVFSHLCGSLRRGGRGGYVQV